MFRVNRTLGSVVAGGFLVGLIVSIAGCGSGAVTFPVDSPEAADKCLQTSIDFVMPQKHLPPGLVPAAEALPAEPTVRVDVELPPETQDKLIYILRVRDALRTRQRANEVAEVDKELLRQYFLKVGHVMDKAAKAGASGSCTCHRESENALCSDYRKDEE
jgi:hypothetical protein